MATHDDLSKADAAATTDEGCTVDWSWLVGRQIESVTSDLQHFRVRFADGQTLSIRAATYQGKAFLAFDPWKPPTP
ncbi:MAG: hypothetical protein IT306_10885 [Chloroflexi bacterium]|nr:hypothetical protein [Chloroflexota bacterium]